MSDYLGKIIVIVGPTSSGKSELAVKLAKTYGGEVISADSRQIYKGMDLGSGKVSPLRKRSGKLTYKNVIHYGLDIASPKRVYSVAKFIEYGEKVMKDIQSKSHVAIICGGTGHWIDALISGQRFPAVKPNHQLRQKLEKIPKQQLLEKLQTLDPNRAASIDKNNSRRLIRALEIVLSTNSPVPAITTNQKKFKQAIWLGLYPGKDELSLKIKKRLSERIKAGMIKEVRLLNQNGLSWERLETFGLEYKYCAWYLQKQISRSEFEEQLARAIIKYSKRQMTWWKRNQQINWFENGIEAEKWVKTKLFKELETRR